MLFPGDEAPGSGLTLPVKYLVQRPPVFVTPDTTVAQAAQAMQRAGISSVLVATEPPGIMTDRDLRNRVLAAGLGPETPVRQAMTHPVVTLDANALVFAALLRMLADNIHHLILVEHRQILGVVTSTDVLHAYASSPLAIRRALERLETPAAFAHYTQKVTESVRTLLRSGLTAPQIARVVSHLNDALVQRLVALAEQTLGPPPTPYAWMVYGSEGRYEQTLVTDQDNALVYGEASPEAAAYFAALAQHVVAGLIQVGFPPCPGGYMATRWCQPLAVWQRMFAQWLRQPEPQALLDATIFFDFRPVAGTLSLQALEDLLAEAQSAHNFLHHMLCAALDWRPPLGWWHRVRRSHGMVDVKRGGITPIVSLGRVAGLAAGTQARATLERLAAAGAAGLILGQDEATTLADLFPFLLRVRLGQQLLALEKQHTPEPQVRFEALSTVEKRHLREAFVLIMQIQESIRAQRHL